MRLAQMLLYLGGRESCCCSDSLLNGQLKNVVFVDGVRTPFCQSGTDYEDMMAHDLQVDSFTNFCLLHQ
jgi:hypothetical protein